MSRAIIWDNHACMPLRPADTSFLPELERHRRAGVTVISLNVAMDMIPWHNTFKVLATMRRWIAKNNDRFLLCDGLDSIADAKATGRLAVMFDIEGATAVDDLPDLVEVYQALGVRWMLLAYNRSNRLGAGCQTPVDTGLTDFGRTVIDRMAEHGVMLCCSHVGARTAMEAIAYNPNPTLFSHSNATAVHSHPRNIDDTLIRACAAKGGVVGLVGLAPFIGSADQASVSRLADHADHIAGLVGPAHIGIGLDFVFDTGEGRELSLKYPGWFSGLDSDKTFPDMLGPESIALLAEELLLRGWDDDSVQGILGANLLRVARQVWN